MDITKLMIGDYVRINPINKIGKVNKINTYKDPEHNKVGVDLLLCDAKSIEPIELTPKIVSCFAENINPKEVYFQLPIEDKYIVSLTFVEIPLVKIQDYLSGDVLLVKSVSYLHELQHLLEIFNITYKFNIEKYESNSY